MASRAGARTAYGYGSDVSLLGRFGWFVENSGKHVHPPRELRPSVRGLFDLHGNLWEWTHDWYRRLRFQGVQRIRWARNGARTACPVAAGGATTRRVAGRRTATRIDPTYRTTDDGFRLALSPSGGAPEAGKGK